MRGISQYCVYVHIMVVVIAYVHYHRPPPPFRVLSSDGNLIPNTPPPGNDSSFNWSMAVQIKPAKGDGLSNKDRLTCLMRLFTQGCKYCIYLCLNKRLDLGNHLHPKRLFEMLQWNCLLREIMVEIVHFHFIINQKTKKSYEGARAPSPAPVYKQATDNECLYLHNKWCIEVESWYTGGGGDVP